ncbi:MAG: SpoIIIAH-like family protein [Vallitaleaceae bacterium]|nr:SpoIIIAH-like family protein [Vallitaleaceae bacterium]
MNTFKKNQIIITALAIMIAIAGYLNFTNKSNPNEDQTVFSSTPQDIVALEATGLVPNDESLLNTNVIEDLSDETAVGTEDPAGITAEGVVTDPAAEDVALDEGVDDEDLVIETAEVDEAADETVGEAVFVSATGVDSIFKSKIDREQTRAYSVEILQGVIDNENLAEEQKVEAASELVGLQDRIQKEAAAESLLEAKGYEAVFVKMDDSTVDVVVNIKELTDIDLAQISDIVSRKTGVDPSLIVISKFKAQQ